MNSISEAYETIEDAAELSEEERSRIYSEFRGIAASNEPTFLAFLQRVPLEETNALFEVYEALAGDAPRWKRVTLAEIDRIFAFAEGSSLPAIVHEPLDALAFYKRTPISAEICEKLMAWTGSTSVSVRRRAVWLLGDLLVSRGGSSVARLQALLTTDPDWRVRNFARCGLTTADALPTDYREPWPDLVRRKVMKEFIY